MAEALDVVTLLVRFIHILAGVVWVGGVAYNGLVVARAMRSVPGPVAGAAMAVIGPRGFQFLSWAGIITIVFGLANQYLIARQGASPGGTWEMVMGVALVLSVGMFAIAHAVIRPALRKMASSAPPPGTPPGPPPAHIVAMQKRLGMFAMINIGLGTLIVFLMVYATRLRIY